MTFREGKVLTGRDTKGLNNEILIEKTDLFWPGRVKQVFNCSIP